MKNVLPELKTITQNPVLLYICLFSPFEKFLQFIFLEMIVADRSAGQ